MWRICTICGARTDAYTCEKDGNPTDTIRSDTVFPGRLFPNETVLENYSVGDLIGVGGMGAVYRGEQKTTRQAVAIKVLWRDLAKDPTEVKRFTREARAASLLAHPNTVRVFDFGVDAKSGAFCMIMEYLVGQKLSDALRRSPVLDPVRTVHICSQVAKALEEAHRKGIVHRDVKPDNIFLQEIAGERDFAKILDFGLAKFITGDYERDQLTRSGYVVGSPEYMAPEQASGGEVTPAADIYSLGIVLFECLTGRLPFDATTTAEVLRMHILKGAPRLIQADNEFTRDIPLALEDVVLRCLDKDPAKRPATADALRIQVLQACDRRRLNTVPMIVLPGMVVAPTSMEESGLPTPPSHLAARPRPQSASYAPVNVQELDAHLTTEPAAKQRQRGLSEDFAAGVIDRVLSAKPADRPDDEPTPDDLARLEAAHSQVPTPADPLGGATQKSVARVPSAPSDAVAAPADVAARPAEVVRPYAPSAVGRGHLASSTDAGRASVPLSDQLDPGGTAQVAVRNARAGAAGLVSAPDASRSPPDSAMPWLWVAGAVLAAAAAVAAWFFNSH